MLNMKRAIGINKNRISALINTPQQYGSLVSPNGRLGKPDEIGIQCNVGIGRRIASAISALASAPPKIRRS